MIEANQEATVTPEATEGEEQADEIVTVKKSDYEKLNQTLGSLKRELKDLKKPKETQETHKEETNSNESERVEKLALRIAGITHADDVDLARKTAKKWGMDIEDVINDEDFKVKLERQQSSRSNVEATSGVKGDGNSASAKNTAEYWIAKGTTPKPDQVPDRKVRAKIIREIMAQGKGKGGFYNS